jgi:hypothetical protein
MALSASHRRAYAIINSSSSPVWLAMIVAPRARATRWLVTNSTPLLASLGVIYELLLGAGIARERKLINYLDPDAVIGALSTPETFLAAWTHYVAFDLFVGRWIWEDGLGRRLGTRSALLLTWMFGPAGLTVYLVRRRAAAGRSR